MSETETSSEASFPPLSRNRDLHMAIVTRAANSFGNHAFNVAVGYYVYQIGRDPLDLGLIGLVQFTPALALFMVAGMVADRIDRRRIVFGCNIVNLIAVAIVGTLIWTGTATVPLILAVLTLQGSARAFFITATQSILPNLVSREQFPRAIAYASSTFKGATLCGPAVSGLLLAWAGEGVFALILVCYGVSATAAFLIGRQIRVAQPAPVTLETLTDGFRYVWRNKIVLGAMSIDLLAVLFGGVVGMLPVFANDILKVGPDGLGIMRAMPGAGGLIVGLMMTRVTTARHLGNQLFLTVAVFGAGIIVFSLSETYWLSLVALLVTGGADMISVYVRQNLIQLATPDNMRGRVSAINSVSINASNEMGDFRAGTMAAFMGATGAVLMGGITTIAVAAIWWRLFPSIRRIDTVDQVRGA